MSRSWTFGAGAAVALALVYAGDGLAHGPGHRPGYVSTVLEIRPSVPGLTATVLGGDQLLSVRNWSNRTVVVLDERGRPLYRFGADGVSRRSGAAWRVVKRGTSYTWHDSRIHWQGADPPAVVVQAPEQAHVIRRWQVRANVDSEAIVIRGSLGWVPAPAAARPERRTGGGIGWLVPALALGAVVGGSLAGAARLRRRRTP